MEKFKKVTKYILNGLNMINALLLVLAPIWGFNITKISDTIIAITGVFSLYLVSGKLFETKENDIPVVVVDTKDMEAEQDDIVEEGE